MNAITENNLKVFELLSRNTKYFKVTLNDGTLTITKGTITRVKLGVKKIETVGILSASLIRIETKDDTYITVGLSSGYFSVSI